MLNIYDLVKAQPEQHRQFAFRDLLFLILDCPPDFVKGEEWAQHNCFLHVLSGTKRLYNREQSWYIQKGDTVFLKKAAFGIERVSPDPFCVLMFFVPDEYICSFMREHAALLAPVDPTMSSKDLVVPVHTTALLDAFYESVMPYFTTSAQPAENLLELKFRELLLHIITTEDNRRLTAYFQKLCLSGTNNLKEIMENNYLFNLQLHEYARLCHRSLSAYKRDFQATFGTPPGRWLQEKRLHFAAHLLQHSGMPILDVALESGFKNVTHFDRVFKKQFGRSPLQYRRLFTPALAHLA